MKGDREKSLASGASDYITKPVDIDRLLAVVRKWLEPRNLATKPSGHHRETGPS